MNIYLVTQDVYQGYDTYDSAVVYAKSAWDARRIHPSSQLFNNSSGNWAEPSDVTVSLLGRANNSQIKPGVICASFNAG